MIALSNHAPVGCRYGPYQRFQPHPGRGPTQGRDQPQEGLDQPQAGLDQPQEGLANPYKGRRAIQAELLQVVEGRDQPQDGVAATRRRGTRQARLAVRATGRQTPRLQTCATFCTRVVSPVARPSSFGVEPVIAAALLADAPSGRAAARTAAANANTVLRMLLLRVFGANLIGRVWVHASCRRALYLEHTKLENVSVIAAGARDLMPPARGGRQTYPAVEEAPD
jgi:hypothetical protein